MVDSESSSYLSGLDNESSSYLSVVENESSSYFSEVYLEHFLVYMCIEFSLCVLILCHFQCTYWIFMSVFCLVLLLVYIETESSPDWIISLHVNGLCLSCAENSCC